jgi:hypothetical protein
VIGEIAAARIEEGDAVIIRGHCEQEGWRRIGLGERTATVFSRN